MQDNARMKDKRILAVHRYYYPDASPYGKILHHMVETWRSRGNTVDVISSQPNYINESAEDERPIDKRQVFTKGVTKRLRLFREKGRLPIFRIVNIVLLLVGVIKHLVTERRFDFVIASTTPPVVVAFFIALGSKIFRYKFIYHYMDIHPEIGASAGYYKNRLVYTLLLWMDTVAARKSYKCVVLSNDMKRSLLQRNRGIKAEKIYVINNFGLDTRLSNRPSIINYQENQLNIIYAGNLGQFQALDVVIQSLSLIGTNVPVFLHLVGDGTEKIRLEELCRKRKLSNVKFYGHISTEEAQLAIAEADLAYLSVADEVLNYAFPSKFSSYLIQGTPVLAAVSDKSDLSKVLVDEELGMSVQLDAKSLANRIKYLVNEQDLISKWTKNVEVKAEKMFGIGTFFDKWEQVFDMREVLCN